MRTKGTIIRVSLPKFAKVNVEGLGRPVTHPKNSKLIDWVENFAKFAEDKTLLDIIFAKTFVFFVDMEPGISKNRFDQALVRHFSRQTVDQSLYHTLDDFSPQQSDRLMLPVYQSVLYNTKKTAIRPDSRRDMTQITATLWW